MSDWDQPFCPLKAYENHRTLITYYSLMFDPVAKAYPPCLPAKATTANLLDLR